MDLSCQLSVIVCTYNRASFLQGCLDALFSQTAPGTSYEVLVVDNNSSDTTAAVVAQMKSRHPLLRYVREDQQGLSYARNRGMNETVSPWIAFVDDDGEVAPDFIESVLRTITEEPFDAFGGVFSPKYAPGKPQWFRDEFASNAMVSAKTCTIPHGPYWFCGGICAFRRSALESVGGFPVNLGMTGKKLAYGEETLVQVRMHRAGFKLGFVPAVRMKHWVTPSKYRMWCFAVRAYGEGRDSWLSHEVAPCWKPLLRVYGSTFKRCIIAGARLTVSWHPRASWLSGACVAEFGSALGSAAGMTVSYFSAPQGKTRKQKEAKTCM